MSLHARTSVVVLLAAGLAATSCGSTSRQLSTTASRAAVSGAAAGATTASTTRPASAAVSPQTAAEAPSGGAVPRGFVPVSFTAISDADFWLLGTAPCSRPVCTSIVRTTDGGAHFVGIPAPPVPLATSSPAAGISTLRFANRVDGFAGPGGFPPTGPLWETHNGGGYWRAGLPNVLNFTVSAGRVYALTATCTNDGVCSNLRLASSPAAQDAWASTPIPGKSSGGLPSLTASGSSVWVELTPAAATPTAQRLFASRDGGHSLTVTAGPCIPGLGGRLEASSPQVVWAVCPTGMLAGAWRSTDGGVHWSHLSPSRELVNSALVAPATDTAALFAVGGEEGLIRTTDGGQSFAPAGGPDHGSCQCMWMGFTDPSTASALVLVPGPVGPDKVPPTELWRSTDGGVSWRGPVPIVAGS